ncbi:MAG: hypothetical protein MPJ50_17150 [Pirellulales bacterium]|nr:hypothetical protein [Pirellulales bacterium]
MQARDGTPVALKVLNPKSELGTDEAIASLAIEIIVGRHSNSDRVIEHKGYGCTDSVIFIARELAHAIPYQSVRDLPPKNAANYFWQFCESVLAIHGIGFAVVDVVPSNFLLCERGIVLADLGSARRVRCDAAGSETVTSTVLAISQRTNRELGHAQIVTEGAYAWDVAGLALIFFESLTGMKAPGTEYFPYLPCKAVSIPRPSSVSKTTLPVFDEIVTQMFDQFRATDPISLSVFASRLREIAGHDSDHL